MEVYVRMKIAYQYIGNEKEIADKIDGLDKLANSHIMKIKNLHWEDIYFMASLDKSIKLIDSFLFAMKKRNITVLATLTRLQMDCVLRTYASTLVEDSGEFCKSIIAEDKQVNKIKDMSGGKMTDRYLCEKLEEYLGYPIYDLYKKISGYVHFSTSSFHHMASCLDECDVTMFISRSNRVEEEKEYTRLSIELANQFYFFGTILIEHIFVSWLEQKK